MYNALTSPIACLALSLLAYSLGLWINEKTKSPFANPLLISCLIVGAVIVIFKIPLETYNEGGGVLTLCLTPATIALAVPIYRQLEILKKHLLPILAGALVGSIVSIGSVYILGNLFGLDAQIVKSLLPKSVTTPIGVALSSSLGGLTAVTSLAIIITGIIGAVCLPAVLKLFGFKHPVATGISIGTASHAVGTSSALQLGEIEGAMSGLAIGIAGLITAIIISVGSAILL
ncbi:MAG TPA: LrgB family protein [Candidatus Butyricicoccus avistercoris]|uniref:LrgB family protein n=1 Tax=Candidatus Butyricicoccus avistercoris TaxID=2838518 RepID=A0A9D1PGX9_9FIRM|nr:LrgB family protein [Candidatus Butyricicoccus avistercoris]